MVVYDAQMFLTMYITNVADLYFGSTPSTARTIKNMRNEYLALYSSVRQQRGGSLCEFEMVDVFE